MYSIGAAGSRRVNMKINGADAYTSPSGVTFRAVGASIFDENVTAQSASIRAFGSEILYTNTDYTPVSIAFEVYRQTATTAAINRAIGYLDTERGTTQSFLTIMEITP